MLAYEATDDDIELYKEAIEKFLKDKPRQWDGLIFFLCEYVNSGKGFLRYKLRVRHVRPWQETPIILNDKSELIQYCKGLAKKMKIDFQGSTQKLRSVGNEAPGFLSNDTTESRTGGIRAMQMPDLSSGQPQDDFISNLKG